MRVRLMPQSHTIKRARPLRSRARAAAGDSQPGLAQADPLRSAMVDVDVDLVGDVDVGRVPAQSKLATEDVQQHQNDDDQQHNGEYSAAATASARLDYGRPLTLNIVAIVGHWKLSLSHLF